MFFVGGKESVSENHTSADLIIFAGQSVVSTLQMSICVFNVTPDVLLKVVR